MKMKFPVAKNKYKVWEVYKRKMWISRVNFVVNILETKSVFGIRINAGSVNKKNIYSLT